MDHLHLAWPFFDDAHRELAREATSWAGREVPRLVGDNDEAGSCRRLVPALGDAGYLRYVVPASVGGVYDRLDARSICLVRESLAQVASLADFAFAMQGLGSGPIALFGSKALCERYLARVATGELITAFALSEREAGSNIAATATTARKDGKDYVIDGAKTWTSNAGIAGAYVVFARTGEGEGSKGLSAFVIDGDADGLEVSETIEVTAPHPLGSLRFDRCRVSASQMIGSAGEGFKIALATLDLFRSSVGAAAVGFARRALDEALNHARERVVFEKPLADFQMTQDKIAEMAVEIDASALLVYRAAWLKDSGVGRVTREAAMAKLFATESAQRVIDRAVQLLGGLGVVRGSVVETLYRDIRPLRIYEGTSEIQKLVIAREVLARTAARE